MARKPRKPRDYPAEEARRKVLAQARGFKSRGAQRYAIEKGRAPAIRPDLLRSLKTLQAQLEAHLLPPVETMRVPESENKPSSRPKFRGKRLTDLELDELMGVDPDVAAEDWSTMHARTFIGEYHPENAAELGFSHAEYRNAYLRCFVFDANYKFYRHRGGSPAMYDWFVTVNHYYSADEYESRYGKSRGR